MNPVILREPVHQLEIYLCGQCFREYSPIQRNFTQRLPTDEQKAYSYNLALTCCICLTCQQPTPDGDNTCKSCKEQQRCHRIAKEYASAVKIPFELYEHPVWVQDPPSWCRTEGFYGTVFELIEDYQSHQCPLPDYCHGSSVIVPGFDPEWLVQSVYNEQIDTSEHTELLHEVDQTFRKVFEDYHKKNPIYDFDDDVIVLLKGQTNLYRIGDRVQSSESMDGLIRHGHVIDMTPMFIRVEWDFIQYPRLEEATRAPFDQATQSIGVPENFVYERERPPQQSYFIESDFSSIEVVKGPVYYHWDAALMWIESIKDGGKR